MELDLTFKALAEATRRQLLYELKERDGQTLFELHVRLITWHGARLSRQALSKHLAMLEGAGLVRIEWAWRSKHHFLEREPLLRVLQTWLAPLVEQSPEGESIENRTDERAGR